MVPHIFHTSTKRAGAISIVLPHSTAIGIPFGQRAKGKFIPCPLIRPSTSCWPTAVSTRRGNGLRTKSPKPAFSILGTSRKPFPLWGGPYEAFVKQYTEKHWGMKARELPAYVITRLPVRFTYDVGYYNDRWQGIPDDGYGALFRKMLANPLIEIRLNTDYFEVQNKLPPHDLLVYSGPIDQFFAYKHGRLRWRSVRFEKEVLNLPDFQGTSVMNECDGDVPYTRTHEFKHFTPERTFDNTVIFREYSYAPNPGDDVYYPVRTDADMAIRAKYKVETEQFPRVVFGGRLGAYAYLDMENTISTALDTFAGLKTRLSQ